MIKQSSCRGALQQPGWSGLMKSVGVEAKLLAAAQPERCQFQTTCNHAAAPLEHCPKIISTHKSLGKTDNPQRAIA